MSLKDRGDEVTVGPDWAAGNLLKLILDWQWKTTIAHKVGAVLGNDFLEIRYEDLVRDPEATLRQICKFIDEPYEQSMLNYSDNPRLVLDFLHEPPPADVGIRL